MTTSEKSQSNSPEYISRRKLSERLGISPSTSYRLDREGIITGYRVGGSIRYDWREVVNNISQTKGGKQNEKK